MTTSQSARVLLGGILDYAGTFPPAGLPLATAVSNYARDRASANAWMLGRLIVPASGLREFEALASKLPNLKNPENLKNRANPENPENLENLENPANLENLFPLSVVLGPQRGSLEEMLSFIDSGATTARVLSVEFPPLKAEEIRAMKGQLPEGLEVFFETPLDADLDKRIAAIADVGAMVKIRTGGMMAGAFPGAQGLVLFFTSCADAGLAVKATAGLHHAVRGSYPLTYEPGSSTATMHGFLNVAVAAALVHVDADPAEATDALAESSDDVFQFGEKGLVWRDRTLTLDELAGARQFFRSFGSCDFRGPVQELTALGLV